MVSRGRPVRAALVAAFAAGLFTAAPAHAADPTTAWSTGQFNVDVPNVVRRSNIVLGQAPAQGTQSMPLGNGTFGAAVWAAERLHRPVQPLGHLPRPPLARPAEHPGPRGDDRRRRTTTPASTSTTRSFTQSGGGMTATTYVRADKDELVVDVTGVDPTVTQTATGEPPERAASPTAAVTGAIGTLAETWVDTASADGGTGKTFGSLAAVTAAGRDVTASVVDSQTVQVSFRPNTDGSFRVVVGVPHWVGGDAATTATALLGSDATAANLDSGAPELVARLLERRRPREADLGGRRRGLHGEPAHAVPLLRGLLRARRVPVLAGGRRGPVQLLARQPELGRRPLLVLEHADADRGQHRRRQLRDERAAVPPLHREPREHREVDEGPHGRPAGHLPAGDDALRRHRLVRRHGHRQRLLRRVRRVLVQQAQHHVGLGGRVVDLAHLPGDRRPRVPGRQYAA